MPVHVSSEIGQLRGVIVHSPGVELDAVTPGNRVEYLYDDIIDSEQARREHQRFVAILERFSPVYHVRDLLGDILANAEARQLLIRETMGIVPSEPLARDIGQLDADSLVRMLIEGREEERSAAGFRLSGADRFFHLRRCIGCAGMDGLQCVAEVERRGGHFAANCKAVGRLR